MSAHPTWDRGFLHRLLAFPPLSIALECATWNACRGQPEGLSSAAAAGMALFSSL